MSHSAQWFKHRRYKFSDITCHIVPTGKAQAYNPLDEPFEGRDGAGCAVSRLLQLTGDTSSGRWSPRRGLPQLFEDFPNMLSYAASYGLWGSFHQDVLFITAPGKSFREGWVRQGGYWMPITHYGGEPGVVLKRSTAIGFEFETLDWLAMEYFPDATLSVPLKPPDSPGFFSNYSEGLRDWYKMAESLALAFERDDRVVLNSYLGAAGVSIGQDFQEAWKLPNLITMVIVQFMMARRAKLRLAVCANERCLPPMREFSPDHQRRVFFGEYRARYCSDACANAAAQRRHRQRKSEE
jgi:hypothetical protein